MKVKTRKSKEEIPFDPVLFAAAVPARTPTAKDRADCKERLDDAIELKEHETMENLIKDL